VHDNLLLLTTKQFIMNEILDEHLNTSALTITPEIKIFLKETAKWGKFLSIVGFVFIAILVIIGLAISIFSGSLLSGLGDTAGVPAGMFGAVGFIYVLVALLYIVPLNFLYKFSSKMKVALAQDDQAFMAESFKNLKSLYKFMGIFMAVILGFYALIFVFGLLGTGISMM